MAVTYVAKPKTPINFIIASLLTLIGSLLLWLAAFSIPYIKKIYYVGLNEGRSNRLGTFGYCGDGATQGCTSSHVGYRYPHLPGGKGLSGSLILTPIAAGLGSLALLSLLYSVKSKKNGLVSLALTLLSAMIAVISFILALIAFVVFHNRASDNGLRPHYGPAMWLHLVGTLALLAAVPFALLGWIRQRRDRNRVVQATTTETTQYHT